MGKYLSDITKQWDNLFSSWGWATSRESGTCNCSATEGSIQTVQEKTEMLKDAVCLSVPGFKITICKRYNHTWNRLVFAKFMCSKVHFVDTYPNCDTLYWQCLALLSNTVHLDVW